MREAVARAVKKGLLAAGLYRRWLARDRFPGVAVLCYHGIRDDDDASGPVPFGDLHVRVSELAGHCRVIRDLCHPISLREWIAADAGTLELPARPVLLTFDDGYRSVWTRARPVLERFHIPAIVFVSGEAVRTGAGFWHDRAATLYGEASVEEAKSMTHEKWRSWERTSAEVATNDDSRPLSPEQVRELAAHPLFDVGGHTSTHLILSKADASVQRREIEENRVELSAWAEGDILAFAYPNGRPRIDYTEETMALVQELGYRMAFSTRPALATSVCSRWERPRFLMLAGITEEELAHRLAFSWRRRAMG